MRLPGMVVNALPPLNFFFSPLLSTFVRFWLHLLAFNPRFTVKFFLSVSVSELIDQLTLSCSRELFSFVPFCYPPLIFPAFPYFVKDPLITISHPHQLSAGLARQCPFIETVSFGRQFDYPPPLKPLPSFPPSAFDRLNCLLKTSPGLL